ncbi:unnamed protein product [Bursaphelenchus okinawaensis]|uniref:Cytochrome P450 n=1 Tax=Bursaphelenchus okinawaensis TaxID=465554 RepID=A0A811KE58_9BILA|nr:unnamed protein product [Bursaphelenchus okinawaensis]CAG9099390.1 unnamed protein product [Bursaphelenchus okinawaensis]
MMEVLLNPDIDKLFLKWKQQFGGIFTFWIGPIPMVMVADVSLLKKYFVKYGDVFSGRWRNFITDHMLDGFNGVVQTDGEKWREQRRFSLHVLRDFGFGRSFMENKVMREIDRFLEHLDLAVDKDDGIIEPDKLLGVCVGNIINDILFSKTFEHTDEVFLEMQHVLDQQSQLVTKPINGLYLTLPFTVHIPYINSSWLKLTKVRDTFWRFLDVQIQEHRQRFDEHLAQCRDKMAQNGNGLKKCDKRLGKGDSALCDGKNGDKSDSDEDFEMIPLMDHRSDNEKVRGNDAETTEKISLQNDDYSDDPKENDLDDNNDVKYDYPDSDFTYVYMKEMHQRKFSDDPGFFTDIQLKMLLLDLFFAGSETTVTTAKWGLVLLINHPEVQKKVQEELDLVPNRVGMEHRNRLSYLQATISEIQRIANILPINLLRTVTEDVNIDGYHFEKGTMVLPQVSILLNDPEHFAEPEHFKPERFLDENQNLRRYDAFMPFSIGKRQCLGESLARMELFLVFANLLRNFEFEKCPGEEAPSKRRILGLTVSPPKFKCKVRRRA